MKSAAHPGPHIRVIMIATRTVPNQTASDALA
jgi:hypothetical protein